MTNTEKPADPAQEAQSAADGKQAADRTHSKGETVLTVLVSLILLAGLAFFLWREGILPGKRDASAPPPAEEAAPAPTPAPTAGPASEHEIWIEGDWDWELDNGVLTIRGQGNMANFDAPEDQPWTAQREQITRVVIEEGITGIGDYAFMYLPAVTEAEIPEGVTAIGAAAFSNCIGLRAVRIPGSLRSIGAGAFWCCSGLRSVQIPAGVTAIGESAFTFCYNLAAIEADPDNPCYRTIGGALFTKDGLTLLCCPAGIESGEAVIPDGVTAIGDCAFEGCVRLKAVQIPDSVTAIGEGAFSDCQSLVGLRIPGGVTVIGGDAFRGCDSLIAAEIAPGVKGIGEGAFADCGRLTELRLPASLTGIGDGAFAGCSGLREISYAGTAEQWEALSLGEGNGALRQAGIRFGEP